MLHLPTVIDAHKLSRSAFNKMVASGHFNYEIPEGSPGKARYIPLLTAHDIGFVAMLMRNGYSGEDAKGVSIRWCMQVAAGHAPHRMWVRNPIAGTLSFIPNTSLLSKLLEPSNNGTWLSDRSPIDIQIFNVGEVIERNSDIEQYTMQKLASSKAKERLAARELEEA